MARIKINKKTGIAYISEHIRKEGFHGDVETLPNAITLTLIRPGTNLKDVKHSLENVLRDIDLRIKYQEKPKEKRERDNDEDST